MDDGVAMPNNGEDVELVKECIRKTLGLGGFEVKEYFSKQDGGSGKLLGLTWDRDDDTYRMRYRINLGTVKRGLRMEADITPEDINRLEAFTRRNLLSLTCTFVYCMGLGTPLVLGLRILYSQVCDKGGVGMQDILEPSVQEKIKEL